MSNDNDNVVNLNERLQRNTVKLEIAAIEDSIDREARIKAAAKEWGCTVKALKEEIDKARKAAKETQKTDKKTAAASEGYIVNDDGDIIPCMANVAALFANNEDVRDMIYWDEVRQCPMVMHEIGEPAQHSLLVYGAAETPAYPRRFTENDANRLLKWTELQGVGFIVKIPELRQVIDLRVNVFRRNPIIEWLESLTWDGVKRVDTWLCDYLGVKPSEYSHEVSRLSMLSIIERIRHPGCKQDYSLVLQSGQGAAKGKVCRILAIADEFHTDSIDNLHSRDTMVMMGAKIIVEIAENVAARKSEVDATKQALTRQTDEFVQKYEKFVTAQKRQSTYIVTINEYEFLQDPTGNRRFWPVVVCETCDTLNRWAKA